MEGKKHPHDPNEKWKDPKTDFSKNQFQPNIVEKTINNYVNQQIQQRKDLEWAVFVHIYQIMHDGEMPSKEEYPDYNK